MENKKHNPISYHLVKSSRKSIGIIVHSDGNVVVRAPHRATKKEIDDVISKRIDWIFKHKKKFEEQGPVYSKREFVDGEKHLLLGKEYVIRVSASAVNNLKLNGDFIDISCNNESLVKPSMEQWYRQKANEMMPQIMMPVVDKFKSIYNISPNKISLKKMKSRWGSCTSKGNISMNIQLIKSTRGCIEYVIAHELCHLIHMNHSKYYYSLLTEFMPDWKERKKKLYHFMR